MTDDVTANKCIKRDHIARVFRMQMQFSMLVRNRFLLKTEVAVSALLSMPRCLAIAAGLKTCFESVNGCLVSTQNRAMH